MEKEEKKLFDSIKRATILSGIGMGLLLGIIMGLSVSEVVKVIMGTLTAMLGAFMGFDKRSFAGMTEEEYLKEKQTSLFTALRAGWFGIAVVAGILFGMWIRTNEVFTISIEKSVKQWTDAGYAPDAARSFVTFQRLGINPKSGELGPVTELQRVHSSNLFSSEQAENLCGATDPDQWNHDWSIAKQSILAMNNKSLITLTEAIEANVDEKSRFDFLSGLNTLLCFMGKNTTEFCKLGADLGAWRTEKATAPIANEITRLPLDKQQVMLEAFAELVCQLEKK